MEPGGRGWAGARAAAAAHTQDRAERPGSGVAVNRHLNASKPRLIRPAVTAHTWPSPHRALGGTLMSAQAYTRSQIRKHACTRPTDRAVFARHHAWIPEAQVHTQLPAAVCLFSPTHRETVPYPSSFTPNGHGDGLRLHMGIHTHRAEHAKY